MRKISKIAIVLSLILFVISIFNIGSAFASNKILKITNVDVSEKSQDVNVDILGFTDDTITSNATYYKLNDFIVYKVTIKNTDKKKHIVDLVIDNNARDYLAYEYDDYKNTILEPYQEADIYIKEVYKTGVTNKSERIQKNKVNFTFNLIEEEKNSKSVKGVEFRVDNGIGFVIYIILAIISFIIIILLLPKKDEKDKKKTKLVLMVLFLIPLLFIGIPTITSAIEKSDSILFDSAISLNDKMVVSYDIDGNVETVLVNYGKPVKEPISPKKDGYTFAGWYYNGKKYDFDKSVTNDIYLTAKFVKTEYNISYNLNGGNANNQNEVIVDELPLTLKDPVKEGYIFTGWTGSNGNTPEKNITIDNIESDLTYTANFDSILYSIDYYGLTDNELANLNNPIVYTIEDTVTLRNPSDRLDSNNEVAHKFIGWRDDDGNISKNISFKNSTENKTYEAIWTKIKPNTHTITYNLNDGTLGGETNPTEYDSSTETFTLHNPTKYGYTFTGWVGSNGNIPQITVTIEKGTASDLTFTAIFTINNYQITYDLDDGVASNPSSYTINDTITLNRPTKEGYTFTGWTGTDLSDKTLDVTIPLNSINDRSYTAHFDIDVYGINYILHGGDVEGNQDTYTINDDFTLNNPTKEGYTFNGWTGSNGSTPSTSVSISHETGDKEYEAIFTANTYTIHYNKNNDDATGNMNDQVITYDEDAYLTTLGYEYEGYIFEGWTTNPDGTGTSYNDGAFVRNIITTGTIELYAKWRKATTATFMTGTQVNQKMKRLSGQSGAVYSTKNTYIQKIKYSTDIPDLSTLNDDNKVSLTISPYPIWIWYENGTIYYGSEADIIYLNTDASYMFNSLDQVTEIDTHFKTDKTTKMIQFAWGNHSLVTFDVSNFNTKNVTEMTSMFGETFVLPVLNISNWDVRRVTTFQHFCNQCKAVKNLDLSNWHTDSVLNLRNTFSSMEALETIDVSNFDTKNVTTFRATFDNCYKLKRLDLSSFNTAKGQNFEQFARNNYELTYIDLSSFDTTAATNMNAMFQNDRNLETLDISTFDTRKITTMNNMFSGMSKIKTIYASSNFELPKLSSNPILFQDDELLVGGAGTTYNANQVKKSYAHIDGGTDNPGYFTSK